MEWMRDKTVDWTVGLIAYSIAIAVILSAVIKTAASHCKFRFGVVSAVVVLLAGLITLIFDYYLFLGE